MSVVVVIVTYGRRLALLRQTIRGLDASTGIARIVVVDNGSAEPVTAAAIGSPHPLSILRIDGNLGSAGGFGRGIAAALDVAEARYLAILDDDNLGCDQYLERLIALHDEHGADDKVAFAALRADRPHYHAMLDRADLPDYQRNAFLGFDIASFPRRLWRKLRGARPGERIHLRAIGRAPYGGLFLTMATARRLGPPRADFILYGDDHEYTRRLTASGVTLFLTDHATVADIDQSWNQAADRGSSWIDTKAPAWRIYYAARNHHYLECTEADVGPMLTINRWALTVRLAAEAVLRHRSLTQVSVAMAPFRAAISDARRERLGYNTLYPLPGWNEIVTPTKP